LPLIVVFCAGSRFLGSPASTASMVAVAGLGLLYAIGVVALTIRTYRQS
jgi:CobQ-like glutamine amidotransferase family enzyme